MPETVLNQEEQKIQSRGQHNNGQGMSRNYRIAGLVLSVVMILLTVYVLKMQQDNNQVMALSSDMAQQAAGSMSGNYRSYVKQYKETKIQLEETTRKLEAVTQELNTVTAQLESTKSMLNETQIMLTQAQAENTKLKEDLQSLDGIKSEQTIQNVTELEARISALKDKNVQTTKELADLRGQLRAFQADFSTIQEGRSLITLFQNKIKLVKSRMRYLAQEAYFAKIAAQKEKDRVAMLNGNNGFLIQNGQVYKPNAAPKSFSIDVKMVQ